MLIIFKLFFYFYSAFKAAEQDDLWHYLTQQARLDGTLPSELTVKTIMDTWTLQMGFPVVNVTRDYDSNEATLIQVNHRKSIPEHFKREYFLSCLTAPANLFYISRNDFLFRHLWNRTHTITSGGFR